ncbi:MAG: DUF3788 domain-containing protein [Firmicutes bacterium]|nr:DUF3788 domain-containing protein [Bacillota bacterium]
MASDEIQLLKDPAVFPSDAVLIGALRRNYSAFAEFNKRLLDYGIKAEQWRYYNDGKSWLSKNIHKRKTVFWLSVWDGFFKVSMFFTEAAAAGIADLPVTEIFKTFQPKWAKLKPLVISVTRDTNLDDLFKVIEYKRNLK